MKYLHFLPLTALLFIQSCASPFNQFYNDRTGGLDITSIPSVSISSAEPRLLKGSNEPYDTQKMLEDGYYMVGFSSFNGADVNESQAIIQAKKVHAEIVILYSQYTNTVSGSMPITTPTTTTSTSNVYGNIYGSGGYGGFSGTSSTTTYGTQTTYIPYSVRRSDYLATYWVKLKPPICGLHVTELSDEQKREIGSNKGVAINVVINESPAFMADIFKGDIILSINEIIIYSPKAYHESITKYQGRNVSVKIYRNGQIIDKKVKLSIQQ